MSRVWALPPQGSTSLTLQVAPPSARALIFPLMELLSVQLLPLRLLKELTLVLNYREQPIIALVLTPLFVSTNNCQPEHILQLHLPIFLQEIWSSQEQTSSPHQPIKPGQISVVFMQTLLPSTQQPKSLPHGL